MRLLIIEDETAAAHNLQSILRTVTPQAEVVDVIDTVVDSIEWFENNPMPDLVFMDIHLSDGESFKIFDKVEITCPVVFTTAYDQYALKAFQVNSIDYLLKPITESAVQRAVDKWHTLTGADRNEYRSRVESMVAEQRNSRHSFLVRFRDKLIPVGQDDIAYCYTSEEKVFAFGYNGERYPMEYTLEALQGMLPPTKFYRANRQFIISRDAVADISVWFGSRLAVNLKVATPEKIIVSKARVPEFKQWLVSSAKL
ncbi:MAG: response regulator transcription factor [Alistipes sp.]|nr:response regulator transcription factor [Alistipes sp.]